MSSPTTSQLAQVARLYYLRDLSKQEIAARLNMSRFRVSRLLVAAREAGLVRIEIHGDTEESDGTAAALEHRFGLRHAVVAQAGADVPALAAKWLPSLVGDRDVIGVAWGATLRAMTLALAPFELGAPVVQICGAIPDLASGTSPSEVALGLAERLGGPLHILPAPAITDAAVRDGLLRNDAVRPTVELLDRVTVALVGIGTRPRNAPAAAVGHLLVHVYDEDGKILPSDLHAIALSVEGLHAARVIAVAAGAAKHRAILGALRTGLIDVLVTDHATARFALEQTG